MCTPADNVFAPISVSFPFAFCLICSATAPDRYYLAAAYALRNFKCERLSPGILRAVNDCYLAGGIGDQGGQVGGPKMRLPKTTVKIILLLSDEVFLLEIYKQTSSLIVQITLITLGRTLPHRKCLMNIQLSLSCQSGSYQRPRCPQLSDLQPADFRCPHVSRKDWHLYCGLWVRKEGVTGVLH